MFSQDDDNQGVVLGVLFGVIALVIGNILLHSGKFLINADRPLATLGAGQVCILGLPLTSRSFPSGHAFSSILLFLFLRPRHSLWAGALVLSLAIAGAVSRIYVGVHFPRDIVTGGLIAVAAWFLAEILAPRLHTWNITQGARTAALVIVGAGTALVYIFLYHEKTRELEYLLTHRAERGQGFAYELLFDGDASTAVHLSGLIDTAGLHDYDGQRSGSKVERSASGRGAVGLRSGVVQALPSADKQALARVLGDETEEGAQTHLLRPNGKHPSYVVTPTLAAEVRQ
mgnify:CR=1 FL=1